MAEQYDLLLKGGTVIDPSQDLQQRCDVAFSDGRVAALAPDLPIAAAQDVIDVSGHLVTPGLIDIHGHFFYRGWPGAVSTDIHTPPPERVVYDLLGVMSTFLALEMPLAAVISSVTDKAAVAIGKSPELGTLRVGSVGDAAVLDLQQGEFTFVDAVAITSSRDNAWLPC